MRAKLTILTRGYNVNPEGGSAEGIKIIGLAERVCFIWQKLYPTYRKPFCWLAEGPSNIIRLPQQNDLRNFLMSEECLRLGQLVANMS